MSASTSVTGERLRRAPVRACLALLLAMPFAVVLVAASSGVAQSAVTGTVVVTPASGSALTVSTFTTSGTCAPSDTVRLKVFGGAGAGATIPVPTTINSPKNMNGAIDASSVTVGAGMEIPASLNWSDFATGGSPVLSRLNGSYTVRAWCSSGTWFDGSITFTGTDTTTATYVAAVPSPSPTATSPSPTATSPSPTATSPSPTATTTSPAPTTASPSPTSASPSTTSASPAPTTTSASPTPTTTSAGPSPSTTPSLPAGTETGQAVDAAGAFIAPGAGVQRGTIVTMVGHGFAPGELLTFSLFSREVVYGHANADSNGAAVYQFALPADLALGAHRLQMTGATHVVVFPFVAVVPAGAPSSTATPAPSASASSNGGSDVSAAEPSGALAETGTSPALFSLGLTTALLLAVGSNLVVGRAPQPAGADHGTGSPRPGRGGGRERLPARLQPRTRTRGRHA